ncbi:MAG TPA: zinc ribbon domain-containing protein [Natrialbaceae archaeon]|nr:zinc ribbon domain-containing protein [Natrialbaceae archaeon]
MGERTYHVEPDEEIDCPNCGKPVRSGLEICPHCEASLN